MESLVNNPIMLGNRTFNTDSNVTVELSQSNISKYFQEIFILVRKNNNQIHNNFYMKEVNNDIIEQMKDNLILWKVSINFIKNKKMFDRLCIFTKEQCEMFNQFGLTFKINNIIVPILNISFKNLIDYISNLDGYTLDIIYNLILLSDYFGDDLKNANHQRHLEIKIKNLEESNYWQMSHNCMQNLTKFFKYRKFNKLNFKKINLDDKEDYLNMIFKPKKYVDASNIFEKNGYKLYNISSSCNYSKDEIFEMLKNLDNKNRYYLFTNLMVSKKYCHLVVNNEKVLDLMKYEFLSKTSLFRYLIGYAWLRFYFEESIKKRNINIKDEFIFDINTASKLPIYPFNIKFPKMNPYMPIMVSDEVLMAKENIGGIKNYKFNETSKQFCNQGICNLDEFKYRLNLFVTNNAEMNLFNNVEWEKWRVSVGGSIMTACLQKQHPLVNMFNEKTIDKKLIRYFNEYYGSSDIDIMFYHENIFEYMNAVENFYNQIIINTCVIYSVEPKYIKLNKLFQLHYFVNNNWIKKNIVNEDITFDYIYKNINTNEIILLFKPFIKNDYEKHIETELKDFNNEEKENLNKCYPDYFKDIDELDIKIHININKENIEISNKIKINYKYRIICPYFNHPLEIFKIYGACPIGAVSQFHLPCVRAFYNGSNVYMTPSCISAHLTYMNIDYKYFVGSISPIEIVNKYRMRGFGTWLNENEIKDLLEYSSQVPFWNNLYGNNSNKKQIPTFNRGCLSLSHNLFHPRLINIKDYYHVQQVDLESGYNDTFKGEEIMNINDLNKEINIKNNIEYLSMDKFVTIDLNGYIKPLQKWIIEVYYNYEELINSDKQVNIVKNNDLEQTKDLIDKEIDLDNLFLI